MLRTRNWNTLRHIHTSLIADFVKRIRGLIVVICQAKHGELEFDLQSSLICVYELPVCGAVHFDEK